MNAKDILARRFEKATFNGYKTEDVDEFLRELSSEFAQLQKEKNELERKLEVLADKIREYRDDEDALKDALLMAQKQGNQIISDAKTAADKLKKETDETVTKQLADAKEKSEKMIKDADEYAKRMTKESNERADKLVKDARAKADEIHTLMQRQTEIQQTVLQKTRKEADEYRNRLISAYQAQIELIGKLPETCENEFVKNAAAEVEKREAERAKAAAAAKQKEAKPAQPKPVEAKPAPKPEDKSEVKEEAKSEEKSEKPAEAPAKKAEPVEEEPFKSVPIEEDNAKTGEFDLPFFSAGSEKKSRHGDLQFGKHK
ncbi:MAG: DivIVA domain-containing protein [Oscillospiraceae bacterium]|nr:DivIVA domain-containing protein [Oscillospiraceae bacterium]